MRALIRSAGGGQPGQELVHRDDLVQRDRLLDAASGTMPGSCGNALVGVGQVDVGVLERHLAASPSGLRMPQTLEVTAQSPKEHTILVRAADLVRHLDVLLVADRALDQADVDVLGILLGVDDRAVDDLDLVERRR